MERRSFQSSRMETLPPQSDAGFTMDSAYGYGAGPDFGAVRLNRRMSAYRIRTLLSDQSPRSDKEDITANRSASTPCPLFEG